MKEIEKRLLEANKIKERINEIENFLFYAERVWTGKIIKTEVKYIFESHHYGTINSKELHLDTEIKNKMLEILRDHLKELEEQLENIFGKWKIFEINDEDVSEQELWKRYKEWKKGFIMKG